VKYLTVVGHAICVSHPEALASDDIERSLSGCVVHEPRVRLIGLPLKECLPLLSGIGHEDLLETQGLFVLFRTDNGV